ncbi:MAG: hypothetical protein ACRC62_27785 [Microcoleus sp.]
MTQINADKFHQVSNVICQLSTLNSQLSTDILCNNLDINNIRQVSQCLSLQL